jgi:hypothetical protein
MDIIEIANLIEDTSQKKGGPSTIILTPLVEMIVYIDKIKDRIDVAQKRLLKYAGDTAHYADRIRNETINAIQRFKTQLSNPLIKQNRQVKVDAWAIVSDNRGEPMLIAGQTPHISERWVRKRNGAQAPGIREIFRNPREVEAGPKFKKLREIFKNWELAQSIEPELATTEPEDIDLFNVDRFGAVAGGYEPDPIDHEHFRAYIQNNYPELYRILINREDYTMRERHIAKQYYQQIITCNMANVIDIIPNE